jgi:cell division protein FtsN
MTQDYAKKPKQPARKKRPSPPGWIWFIAGLLIGMLGSFLIYVWHELPSNQKVMVDAPISTPDTPKADEMKWDFYDIFPKSEVLVEQLSSPPARTVNTTTNTAVPVPYLLQVGAFRNAGDADRVRAEIILMGLASFTRAVDKEGVTWHRVIVGPFNAETELNRTRARLAAAGIPSITLRETP